MPDLIRHPVSFWFPAFAGMTTFGYLTAGAIAGDLCFIDKVDLSVSIEDINEVERMLMALIKTLEQKHLAP